MRAIRWLHSFLAVVLMLTAGTASLSAYAVHSPEALSTAVLNISRQDAYRFEKLRLTLESRNGLFVANNPVNLVDPNGFEPMSAWGFGGMQAPGAVAGGVYQQTGNPSAALQAATGLGNASFQHQVNQAATGAAIGIAAPALAVGAIEAAPAISSATVTAAYTIANVALTNPEGVAIGAEFIVGAIDPNPPTGTDSAASWWASTAGNVWNWLLENYDNNKTCN